MTSRLVGTLTLVSLLSFGCGGGGSANTAAGTGQPAPGAATPTSSGSQSGGVDLVEKLVVLDAQEKVPGKLDYKLAPIVCNNQQTKTSQKVTVRYADPSATVLSAETQIGASHYGQCKLNTQSPLEVRTDKAAGFDASKVTLDIEDAKPLATNPVRMVKLDLYQPGGRAGHEALLPLNTAFPKAAQTLALRAVVEGNGLSASYKVLTPKGETLREASNFTTPSNSDGTRAFVAEFLVPSVPFHIQITARDSSSNTLSWTSEAYTPQQSLLRIKLQNAVFTAPQTTRSGTVTGSVSKAGTLLVRLHLPAGLESDWTQKTIQVTSGQTLDLPFVLTAPATLQVGKFRVFAQYKLDGDGDVLIKAPVLIAPTLH